MVYSGYRRDDFAEPDSFLLQLGMVLERYTDSVINDVTSPLTGIQRKYKTPPSIGAIVEFCDDEVERREKIKRYSEMRTTRYEPHVPTNRANVFVPANNPRYAEMVARSQKADPMEWRRDDTRPGIWVVRVWLESGPPASEGFRTLTGDELRSLYGRDPTATRPTGETTRAKDEAEWHDFLEDR